MELRGLDFVSERIEKADGFGVIHPAAALLRTNITRPATASSTEPPTTFNSNNQTDATPGGGLAERITAAAAINAPPLPAPRRAAVKSPAKMETDGSSAALTSLSTRVRGEGRK